MIVIVTMFDPKLLTTSCLLLVSMSTYLNELSSSSFCFVDVAFAIFSPSVSIAFFIFSKFVSVLRLFSSMFTLMSFSSFSSVSIFSFVTSSFSLVVSIFSLVV